MRSIGPVVAALLALTGAVVAQSPGELDAVLERDRERLHPSIRPLRIVGLEQERNDFRSGTPALLQSDYETTLVDVEALRRQRLDAYAGTQPVARRPPAARGSYVTVTRAEPDPSREAVEPVPEAASSDWADAVWMVVCGVGVTFLLVIAARRRE